MYSSNLKLSPSLENLIQQNYPGPALPPLWEVIYQEAIRGHHLLFKRADVEKFESEQFDDAGLNDDEELELNVLKVMACAELQMMVKLVDSMPVSRRRQLFSFYKRALVMWTHYVKSHLN